jgi:hypothetical protein
MGTGTPCPILAVILSEIAAATESKNLPLEILSQGWDAAIADRVPDFAAAPPGATAFTAARCID